VKLSKSAIKKAARAARLEKKHNPKVSRTAGRSSASEDPQIHLPGSVLDPMELQNEVESASEPSVHDAPLESERRAATPNGGVNQANIVPPSPPPALLETFDRSRPDPTSHPVERLVVEPPTVVVGGRLPVQEKSSSQEAEQVKKRQNVVTRTLWTFIMIGGFIGMCFVHHMLLQI
jgi:phosphatidate cytidylyltransferase